ncbi:MAG: Ig domain-containing protein [Acidimicrobiia bacterium]
MRVKVGWKRPGLRSRSVRRAFVGLWVTSALALVVTPMLSSPPTAAAATLAPSTVPQLAWIQWTGPTGYPGSCPFSASIVSGSTYNYTYAKETVGTIAVPDGSTIYVKFTGEILCYSGASGFNIASNSYWKSSNGVGIDGAAYRSANVPDVPSNGDRIAVSGSATGGVQLQTLEFFTDSARTIPASVKNLVMDIWSLGRPGDEGVWNFTQNFDILSDNKSPISVYSGFTKVAGGPPYALSGFEGTGTVQFTGTYSSVAWTVANPEFYAAWNIGVTTATAPSDPKITPSTTTITGTTGTTITPVTFTDSGFVGAVTYAVKSGTLPAGLTLNPATGEITGTPTDPATATVVIEATGATSGVTSASLDFTFTSPVVTTTTTAPVVTTTTAPVVTTTVPNSGGGSLPVTGAPFLFFGIAGLLVLAAGFFAFSLGFSGTSSVGAALPVRSSARSSAPTQVSTVSTPMADSSVSARIAELRARLGRLEVVPGEGVAQWRAQLQSELRDLGVSDD